MVWPAGGAKVALIGTGVVTIEPSPGEGAVMVGAGGAGFHVMVTTLEISNTPLTVEVAWSESVPALALWYVKVANPVESVTADCVWAFAPVMFSATARFGSATP